MNGILDFLQAASNSAAGTVSGPVDLIGMGLRKLGVPVPQNSLLSSEWMKQKGLMADTPQNAASLAGETFGLLSPVVAAAKAPQIARGLLAMGENAAAPRALGTQRGVLSIGAQHEALKTAQRNAAKPVSDGGLGLRPDNTPMERAKAMGFSENDLLHGGTNDFKAFRVSDRSNVYATDSPEIADIYATATGRHSALRDVNAGPNVIPIKYRGSLVSVSDQGPGGGGWYSDNLAELLGINTDELSVAMRRKLVKEVPNHGYSGVKITDMSDLGGIQSQYVFPDPSVLRSRFAAFDPARIKENDLLGAADPALLALLGLGAGGLVYAGQKD